MVWDYTCPDNFAESHLPHTSATAGAAAEGAERAMTAKYVAFQSQYDVIPVAIETLGVYGNSAMAFIRDLGGDWFALQASVAPVPSYVSVSL